jgi:hypothetical protein
MPVYNGERYLDEAIASAGLLYFLVWRDVKVRYKQTNAAREVRRGVAVPLVCNAVSRCPSPPQGGEGAAKRRVRGRPSREARPLIRPSATFSPVQRGRRATG